MDDSLRYADDSEIDTKQLSSVFTSDRPPNEPSTAHPHRIGLSSPMSTSTRPADYFPASKHLAQSDPDYNRGPVVPSQPTAGASAGGELKNTELFRPFLRKKARQGTASTTKYDAPSPQHTSAKLQATQQSSKSRTAATQTPAAGQQSSRKSKQTQEPPAQKRMYNEGYSERIKSIEDSDLFFRVPLDYESTIARLQAIYNNIISLEAKQTADLENLRKTTSNTPFDEKVWASFTRQQTQLVECYADFLYYASSTSEKATLTKGLIRKYKIPTRLWNNGISLFVDVLRSLSPSSNRVLATFVIHCMNLLMLFTDPIYDTRHIWIESLGDLALVCLMSNVRACADWREMCMYWYQRRALLTAGTGRLYRHMATISESKVNSLFYICKSLTATQPMSISSRDLVSMLNHTIVSGTSAKIESKPLVNKSFALATYIEWHLFCLSIMGAAPPAILKKHLFQDIIQSDSLIVNHGATIAFCNIAALLMYGDKSCSLYNYLKQVIKKRRPGSKDFESKDIKNSDMDEISDEMIVTSPLPGEMESLKRNKDFANEILSNFLAVVEMSAALQHVLVWMYFLLALSFVPAPLRDFYADESFPFDILTHFINKLIKGEKESQFYSSNLVELELSTPRLGPRRENPAPEELLKEYAKKAPKDAPALADSIPGLADRPLPEEVHIRGFAWSMLLPNYAYLTKEVTPLDEPYVAYYGETYLTEVRVKRILALVQEISKNSTWFKYDSENGLYKESSKVTRSLAPILLQE